MIRMPVALATGLALMTSVATAQAPPATTARPVPVPASPPAAAATPAPTPTPPAVVPDTDVFVADLDLAAGKARAPRNITARPGYDNQPAFLADGNGLLYVVRDDSGSTDVWRIDVASGQRTQVTATPAAEYSPTPLADGSGFSAVRVDAPHAEGEPFTESQRLFKYGFDGKAIGPVFADIRRVGYHAWIDATHVALFLVGNADAKVANSLVLATLPEGRVTALAKDIGRSLGRAPDGRVVFVDQSVADAWTVATIAPGDTAPTVLIAVPRSETDAKKTDATAKKDAKPGTDAKAKSDAPPVDQSQDFCWLADGTLLMANGNRLLRWNGKTGSTWATLGEFARLPGPIRRLAVSRDGTRVAFVVEMPAAPKTGG